MIISILEHLQTTGVGYYTGQMQCW